MIVGDGAERPALQALAAELGLAERVEFAGHQADTPAFYARFDVFALSSDTEQMPLSVIEAMASGLPVVSTDVGDVRLMVAAENAPFITGLDEDSMTGALAALVADPAARQQDRFGQLGQGSAGFRSGGDVRHACRPVAWGCRESVTVVRVTGVVDFAELGMRWRDLEARADCSFFQTWTWVGCLASERFTDPVLVEATEDGRTIALALFNQDAARRAVSERERIGAAGLSLCGAERDTGRGRARSRN